MPEIIFLRWLDIKTKQFRVAFNAQQSKSTPRNNADLEVLVLKFTPWSSPSSTAKNDCNWAKLSTPSEDITPKIRVKCSIIHKLQIEYQRYKYTLHFLSKNFLKMWISKKKNGFILKWILWKMRFSKSEFCEKWDFQKVNFVKNEIF